MNDNKLLFNIRDVYPNLGYIETSTDVVPEVEDQEALNQNPEEAQEVSPKASKKSIFLALGVIVALVVFLGAD